MSSVRMCDKCGTIFSELEVGWSTAQQSQIIIDDRGHRTSREVYVDTCSDCSNNVRELAQNLAKMRRSARLANLELMAGITRTDDIEEELSKADD